MLRIGVLLGYYLYYRGWCVRFVGCLCVAMSCRLLRICLTALLFRKTGQRRRERAAALKWKRVGLIGGAGAAAAAAAAAKENNKRQQAIVCWQSSQQKWLFDFDTHCYLQIYLVACVAIRVCMKLWVCVLALISLFERTEDRAVAAGIAYRFFLLFPFRKVSSSVAVLAATAAAGCHRHCCFVALVRQAH